MKRVFGGRPALAIFLGVGAVYALVAWDRVLAPSPQFHFVDLAESFMAGRLDTDTPRQRRGYRGSDDDPPGYREGIARTYESGGWNDWASIRKIKLASAHTLDDGTVIQELKGHFPWSDDSGEKKHLFHTTNRLEIKIDPFRDLARDCGKSGHKRCDETLYYVSFPPFPAFVMMPFAAIWGYDTNDVLITIAVAALNAVLLFWLLELLAVRGHSKRSTRENVWLTVLFALGSVAFFSSVRGEVWFTALVFGVALNLFYMLAALDARHPILAGAMLGLGMATRTPIAFCFVFFAWQLFLPGGRWEAGRWGEIIKKGLLFSIPVLAVGITLMFYNEARFDSPFEFGHRYLSGGAGQRIRDHGLFDFWYLNGNLSAALVNMPRLSSTAPYFLVTKHGLSLLVTTPALLLLLWPLRRPPLGRALWLTVAAAAIPGLLYQNTGWEQFGYRFALDYFPYLMALLAIGGRPLTGKVKLFIALAILLNLFGAITFKRFGMFYY